MSNSHDFSRLMSALNTGNEATDAAAVDAETETMPLALQVNSGMEGQGRRGRTNNHRRGLDIDIDVDDVPQSNSPLSSSTHIVLPRTCVSRVIYSIAIFSIGFFAALFFFEFHLNVSHSAYSSSSSSSSVTASQSSIDELRLQLSVAIDEMKQLQQQSNLQMSHDRTVTVPIATTEKAEAEQPVTVTNDQVTTNAEVVQQPPAPLATPVVPDAFPLSETEMSDVWLRNRTSLMNLLHTRLATLRGRYPPGMDFTSSHVLHLSTHQRANRTESPTIPTTLLTNALTESYFGLRPEQFIIGVTGGSSSPGVDSYPALIKSWFASQLNFEIGIRNGASGATSQIQTAGCIYQIIGDRTEFDSNTTISQEIDVDTYLQAPAVDLLLWEFAMNDERLVYHWARGSEYRRVAIETYLRGLFSHGSRMPHAVGFVHLWDITIHEWEFNSDHRIPDLTWEPLKEVMNYFEPFFDFFAVNVIRFFIGPSCVDPITNAQYNPPPATCVSACSTCTSKRQALLRDVHHPNPKGYAVIRDIMLHSILTQWLDSLIYEVDTYRSMKAAEPLLRSLPHDAIPIHKPDPRKALLAPFLTPNTVLPITYGMHSACIIGSQPLFAPPDPHLRFECDPAAPEDNSPPSFAPVTFTGSDHLNPGFLPVCPRVPPVDFAVWNFNRGDRKMPFQIPVHNCSSAPLAWDRNPPFFTASTTDANGIVTYHPEPPFLPPLVIHILGMNRMRYAFFECAYPNWNCPGIRVMWAGRELKANLDCTDTVFDADTTSWMHKFTDEEIEFAKGKPTHFTISHCPSAEVPRLLLYRLSVWYEN